MRGRHTETLAGVPRLDERDRVHPAAGPPGLPTPGGTAAAAQLAWSFARGRLETALEETVHEALVPLLAEAPRGERLWLALRLDAPIRAAADAAIVVLVSELERLLADAPPGLARRLDEPTVAAHR